MTTTNKLKWHCRRGMKELDVLLLQYLEQNYHKASKKEQQAFENLLKKSDFDLYAYLTEQKIPANKDVQNLIKKLANI
jgi:antitoxin CptB